MATLATFGKDAFLHGRWSSEDAARLYGFPDWGKGYFGVNGAGHVTVHTDKRPEGSIDLHELVEGLRERGIHPPVLLRFNDILDHRLREIRTAFDTAMREQSYTGGFTAVYPVKVNQQAHVCTEIRNIGAQLGFGLEAGSKPELLAVLGLTEGHNDMPIVCNGFKDEEFIETVILATKLGRRIIPVVEKFTELELIVRLAQKYGVKPLIGVRVKLSARGAGRWESSAGARSKFGLVISELLATVEYLRKRDMLDCLNMLHCHIGSQVFDIRQVKNAVTELGHIYSELRRLGAPLGILDIGGGLGIDYDGSQSASESSINYSVNEYAADVVYRVKGICDETKTPHPMIVTECGRAMVAYSSVLIIDVVGSSSFRTEVDIAEIRNTCKAEEEREGARPQPLVDMITAFDELTDRNYLETYHDVMQARDEAMSLFNLGYMSLPARAAVERLFWALGTRLLDTARKVGGRARSGELPEEFEPLPGMLSDIYFCNFSLFQSMPDSWAIDQMFPICPIHRLNEPPTRMAVLADITCDSDGKIDRFVDKREEKRTLELHERREGEPYYLAAFLLGAYQEILGDLHNLLGDTHAVHVRREARGEGDGGSGGWTIEEFVPGDTVREVLEYVQFDTQSLTRAMRKDIEDAVRAGRLTVQEGKALLTFYENGLSGYTYLEE